MTDFEKKLSLSLSNLKKVQRRVTALEETSQHSMSYLERAADNCWEYPNADDKYPELSEKMLKLETTQNDLSEVSEHLAIIIEKLSKIG